MACRAPPRASLGAKHDALIAVVDAENVGREVIVVVAFVNVEWMAEAVSMSSSELLVV